MKPKVLVVDDEQDIRAVSYTHLNPDYDAFGSQFGMYDLIKNTFSNKTVYMEGDFSSDLVQKFNIEMNIEKPKFEQPVLGIVLDTANKERIDWESYQQCKEIIKIDHHIVVESYGNINLEDSLSLIHIYYMVFKRKCLN